MLVLGSGPGGQKAAIAASRLGRRISARYAPFPYMVSRRRTEVGVGAKNLADIRRRLAAVEERLEHLERGPAPGGTSDGLNRLSETERRITALVAAGRTDEEVSERLFLTPKAVAWSLAKIYRKLRVRSRTELAANIGVRLLGPGNPSGRRCGGSARVRAAHDELIVPLPSSLDP